MKILCNGCSFTYGSGFLDHERQEKTWPALLGKKFGENVHVKNIAYPGSSNLEIFLRTLREVQTNKYDLVAIQWSELRRHWFEPGIDRYYMCAGNPGDFESHWRHKNIYLTKKQRKEFYNTLTMLTGDYKCIVDLATFCQTLIQLKLPKQQLIFINGLLPWTQDIANPLSPGMDLYKNFSDFSRDLLEFNDHDDSSIIKNHSVLYQSLTPTLKYWVNFADSWWSNIVDVATEGHHPGPKSHEWLTNRVFSHLQNIS